MRSTLVCACLAVFLIAMVHADSNNVNAIKNSAALADAQEAIKSLQAAQARHAQLMQNQNRLNLDLDTYWLVYNGVVILLMQAGLALYEAGQVRQCAQAHVFFKNIIVCAVVAVTWWLIGYALAYGDNRNATRNGFIGNGDFILSSDADSQTPAYGRWFFEWTYALIPTTIVTMAVSERLRISGIITISVIISGFVYPVVAHWMWSNAGWASPFAQDIGRMGDQGVLDFAGSGTIFLVGGAAGLAATVAVGPRQGRFEEEHCEKFRPKNKLYVTFGSLLIWFTSFAFMAGRTLKLSGPQDFSGAAVASKVLINHLLGSVGGFLGGFPLYYLLTSAENFNVAALTDCVIAGIAATAAGVALVEPWAAGFIGILGGLLYTLFAKLLSSKVDDTVNGFAIFAVPGLWGLLAVGLLATEYGVLRAYGKDTSAVGASGFTLASVKYGLFYQGLGDVLWGNLVGLIAIFAWSFVIPLVIIKIALAASGGSLRLLSEEERFGADQSVYAEYQVTEAFVDGMDELFAKLQLQGLSGTAGDLGAEVPRWLLVDFRANNEKKEEPKK